MRLATHRLTADAVMRAAARERAQPPQVVTLPAPVGGWNARDAWSEMDQQDAIRLDNWYPGFGKCTVRKGSRLFATLNTASAVETLAELKLSSGNKLLAAAGGGLWDATAGGTISTALGGTTPFANDRWQWAAMNDKLGLVNGANAPQTYDGTAKAAMTISGVGLTVADLVGINVFKSRSYFWTGEDQDFWYSAVNTLGGSLTNFPLGDVGSFGGVLTSMFTWTRDGGAGMDDLAVFLMSSGEAIVYAGSDPGSADDWSLVGVFRIGSPVGIRAHAKVGGDVLIVTADGYSLLSKALPGGRASRGASISDKIVNAAIEQIRATSGSFGWNALLYPRGQRLMINYPTGARFEQHVVNLATGSWCRFRGMDARCWVLFGDAPYFGGAGGKIYEADTGANDAGLKIIADGRQAFSYLGARGRNKHVTMLGPLLEGIGTVPMRIGLAADFDPNPGTTVDAILGSESATGSLWDVAVWDVAEWGATSATIQGWLAHSARGYAISPSIRVEQSAAAVSWNATRFAYRTAGVI